MINWMITQEVQLIKEMKNLQLEIRDFENVEYLYQMTVNPTLTDRIKEARELNSESSILIEQIQSEKRPDLSINVDGIIRHKSQLWDPMIRS
ncbi:hypothetical protein MA16_Dca019986 [Dendrobium catenatum]|uniref:Uncharacterized protein n=1 Tax=Dendrobium catenatum TaxID=906689 RepID=A0A2I0WCM7_9ASPA|nr:hypothetical protein MA16_Dca019986 [Dendrobium catenatum]